MDDAAIIAFREAQLERRLRGAFRLLGVVAGVAIAFVLSLAQLEVLREPVALLVLVPLVGFTLLGELAVRLLHGWRARNPRIPRAKLRR